MLLLLASPAQGQLTSERSAGPVCVEGTGTPPLGLAWRELPDEGSIASLSVVHLAVTNNTRANLRVRVLVAGALDAFRQTLSPGEIVVKARSTSVLAVDLSAFQYNLAARPR